MSARTIALATHPLAINGVIEVPKPVRRAPAEVPPRPIAPSDARFEPPDADLLRRVLEGLRALPGNSPETMRFPSQ